MWSTIDDDYSPPWGLSNYILLEMFEFYFIVVNKLLNIFFIYRIIKLINCTNYISYS